MSDNLNAHFQDCILQLCITDDEFISLVVGQVRQDYFTSASGRMIFNCCVDYFSVEKKSPKYHFQDELAFKLEDKDDQTKELVSVHVKKLQVAHTAKKEYVLNRLNDFIREREWESAVIDMADRVVKGDIPSIEQIALQTLKKGIHKQDKGLDYLYDLNGIYMRGEVPEYRCQTGIGALDQLIGGLQGKQLVLIAGGYKGGKTWAMQHMAMSIMQQGLNVCFFSHECTQEELEDRFDMMVARCGNGKGKKKIGETVSYSVYDNHNDEVIQKTEIVKSLYNKNRIKSARLAMRRLGGNIVIKKYPMGTCTVEEMERYMNYIEKFHGFIPDVVITDYVEIMDISSYGTEERHQINETYIKLKGMADERDIVVITGTQVTADALEKTKIKRKDVANDKRKVGNVDFLFALSSNEDMDKAGMKKLTVVASRSSGSQGTTCTISHCLDIGQFCIDSWIGDRYDADVMDVFGDID